MSKHLKKRRGQASDKTDEHPASLAGPAEETADVDEKPGITDSGDDLESSIAGLSVEQIAMFERLLHKRRRLLHGSDSQTKPPDMQETAHASPQGQPWQDSLWARYLMTDLNLPLPMLAQILEALGTRFPQRKVLSLTSEAWFVELENWPIFATMVSDCQDVDMTTVLIEELLFSVSRIVLSQDEAAVDVSKSDSQALKDLRELGFNVGRGQVWGANNCLTDSLLQLLVHHGVLTAAAGAPEERE
eukprot:1435888-Karenia_brevis.AAC.1